MDCCALIIVLLIREPDDDGDDNDGDDEEQEDAHGDGAQQPGHHAVGRVDLIQICQHVENHVENWQKCETAFYSHVLPIQG